MTSLKTASSKRLRVLILVIALPVMMLSLHACRGLAPLPPDTTRNQTYPVDPLLKRFYKELQGEDFLGAAISPLLKIEDDLCQYTVSALLCHDPQATGVARFYLMALGTQMDITEQPAGGDPRDNTIVVDGYVIYPEILPLYEQYMGKLYAGRPLTNAFYNPTTRQIEQYFENLGFYYDPQSPGPKSGLIAYGQQICRQKCPDSLLAIPPSSLPRQDPISDMIVAIEFLGGDTVFGERLTEVSIAPDGSLEVVYENAVFYAPARSPRQVQLRELPAELGLPVTAPSAQRYGAEENVTFYPVQGELGYHVPLVFERFLQRHGGFLLSGDPTGDPVQLHASDLPSQCYRYLCLQYDRNAASGNQVKLVNLGELYLQSGVELQPYTPLGGVGAALQATPPPAARLLSFLISEKSPQVRRSEPQEIEIFVFDRRTYQPAAGIAATLVISGPNGIQVECTFPPTGPDGVSHAQVPPLTNAPHGSLVSYRVCLIDAQAACKAEGYIIWGE